ncbi:sigma-fimbriae subunit [Yersinia nurmii]|uniref:Sigma-fimbriae subunit n=2 Tax=Yersinia nurmii TaxID=685706 RepID=A0ABM9S5Z7_9GAMM|nr:sigma-fimbriae subunit [Yersinia nurmii]
MKKYYLICGVGIPMIILNSALAATTTGSISATLTLTNGCLVNNSAATSGLALGTLSFGSFTTTGFTGGSATLSGASGTGSSAISVKCSPGITPVLTITGSNAAPANIHGTVPSTGPRYLVGTTNTTQAIAYGLYTSNTFTTPIVNATTVTPTTTGDATYGNLYTFFGNITGVTGGTDIYPDIYTDTIGVQVTY